MSGDSTSENDFARLLNWLDADPERAAEKYERIRRNLISFFRRKGAEDPLALADDVFVRVTKNVCKVAPDFVGEPKHYFLGVARYVLLESRRRPSLVELTVDISARAQPESDDSREVQVQLMEECWRRLPAAEQAIMKRYYAETAGKASREELAAELKTTINALRVTTHRIRGKLKRCMERLSRGKNLK